MSTATQAHVAEIMTRDVMTLRPDQTLQAAEQDALWDYAEGCYRALEEHARARRVVRQRTMLRPTP